MLDGCVIYRLSLYNYTNISFHGRRHHTVINILTVFKCPLVLYIQPSKTKHQPTNSLITSGTKSHVTDDGLWTAQAKRSVSPFGEKSAGQSVGVRNPEEGWVPRGRDGSGCAIAGSGVRDCKTRGSVTDQPWRFKVEVPFYLTSPRFPKEHCFREVNRLHPFVLLIKHRKCPGISDDSVIPSMNSLNRVVQSWPEIAAKVDWETLGLTDLAPCEFHLFLTLSENRFTCDEEVKHANITCLIRQDILLMRLGLINLWQVATFDSILMRSVLTDCVPVGSFVAYYHSPLLKSCPLLMDKEI